ncbi:hypothetical protein QOZ80_2AG0118480 [Eleusine coracana subsp. coracana]|nr:hypothetical protein QOZ80_2AG0118480 [Eleusine coracana subsp. coracana]
MICGHILRTASDSRKACPAPDTREREPEEAGRHSSLPSVGEGNSGSASIPLHASSHSTHAMATTAAIGINAFPRPVSARPRTLPRCRPLFSSSSSSASPPRGRPVASPALKHGSITSFMGPSRNATSDLRRGLIVPSAGGTGGNSVTSSSGPLPTVLGAAHLIVSLGIVLAADKFLKQAFVAASIKFPSSLFGMFCVLSVLLVFDTFVPVLAKAFMDFFEPATLFIQRWLPLFYVPSLVVLPLAVRDVPVASGLKIFLITFGGWLASLAVAGYTALAVRKLVKTQLIPAEPMSKPSPFSTFETWAWAAIFVASFGLAYFNPTALGTTARTCLPFLLASTVLGYMVTTWCQESIASNHLLCTFG